MVAVDFSEPQKSNLLGPGLVGDYPRCSWATSSLNGSKNKLSQDMCRGQAEAGSRVAGGRRGLTGEQSSSTSCGPGPWACPWGRLHKPSCAGLRLPVSASPLAPVLASHSLLWVPAYVHSWGRQGAGQDTVAGPPITGQGAFLISLLILVPNKTGWALLPPAVVSGLWLLCEHCRRLRPAEPLGLGRCSWLLAHVQPCLRQEWELCHSRHPRMLPQRQFRDAFWVSGMAGGGEQGDRVQQGSKCPKTAGYEAWAPHRSFLIKIVVEFWF
jgi:hypothetical protein